MESRSIGWWLSVCPRHKVNTKRSLETSPTEKINQSTEVKMRTPNIARRMVGFILAVENK